MADLFHILQEKPNKNARDQTKKWIILSNQTSTQNLYVDILLKLKHK